jgi:hypothetical protein
MLIDDLHMDRSLSEESLATDFEGVDLSNKKGKRTATKRSIVDTDDDDNDIFDFSSALNSKK